MILPPESYEAWLNGTAGTEVLEPFPANLMKAYPVSTRVGSPKNDDETIIEPLHA